MDSSFHASCLIYQKTTLIAASGYVSQLLSQLLGEGPCYKCRTSNTSNRDLFPGKRRNERQEFDTFVFTHREIQACGAAQHYSA
jgi:hypothetical protein